MGISKKLGGGGGYLPALFGSLKPRKGEGDPTTQLDILDERIAQSPRVFYGKLSLAGFCGCRAVKVQTWFFPNEATTCKLSWNP